MYLLLLWNLKSALSKNLVKKESQTIVCKKRLQLPPPRLSFAKCLCLFWIFISSFLSHKKTVNSSSKDLSRRRKWYEDETLTPASFPHPNRKEFWCAYVYSYLQPFVLSSCLTKHLSFVSIYFSFAIILSKLLRPFTTTEPLHYPTSINYFCIELYISTEPFMISEKRFEIKESSVI